MLVKDIIDDVTELRTLVFEKLEQFGFAELRKSGLTKLKVKNASCLKGKKMGIRKCFLQGGD